MNYIFSLIMSAVIGIGSFFGITDTQKSIHILENKVENIEQNVGAATFNPAGGLTYRTQTSVGTTDTTINLSSFKNRSDLALTMELLNTDIGYGTLSPQTSRSEFISFTGVTQNSNGTAQLTGVTRGLSDIYPFTASTTLRNAHAGQSVFILSDSPTLFDEYAKKRTDEAITGLWSFNSYLPTSSIQATSSTQFTNKNYVDNVANAGSATSTLTNGGIIEIATTDELASSTDSDLEKPRALVADYSTSSPYAIGNWIPITDDDGKLNQTFYRTTESLNWLGDLTLDGSTTPLTALYGSTSVYQLEIQDEASLASSTANKLIVNNLQATSTLFAEELTVNKCTGCDGTSTLVIPGDFALGNGLTIVQDSTNNKQFLRSADAVAASDGAVNVKVPSGVSTLKNVRFYFESTNASADIWITWGFSNLDLDVGSSTPQTDSVAIAAYNVGASVGTIGHLDVPPSAYDGLTSMSEGDIVGMYMNRISSNAADTINGNFDIVGIKFIFQ